MKTRDEVAPKSHQQLCEKAASWLRGLMRCDPVLYGIASAAEVPDAIGWGSNGSVVVECKVSVVDFLRDKRKRHQNRMGDRRFFMCPVGLVTAEYVEKHYPDHGLLCIHGRKVIMERAAPVRTNPHHRAEIRYLRFALIHVRSNLLKLGCSVNLAALAQFFGEDGICLPAEKRQFYQAPPMPELGVANAKQG